MLFRTATQSLLRRTVTNPKSAIAITASRHRRYLVSSSRGFASAAVHDDNRLGSSSSPWLNFPMAPPDPIIGLTEAYLKDDSPDKVSYFD